MPKKLRAAEEAKLARENQRRWQQQREAEEKALLSRLAAKYGQPA